MKYEVFYGKNNGYCYKDEQGKIVSKTYKYAHPFDENGIALVCGFFDDYYYINEKFEKISPVYHFASDFFTVGNKRMAVTQENSKSDWYFIDQNFKKISPPFSSLFSIWCSDYYNNNDKLPFITLNCTDYSDTNFPDYYLDTNFQQVSPRYRSTGKFKYFAPLDENCAEVNDVVDGKTLYYLINEDFVKITHGVEKWPSDWAIFLDHIIPEKVKSNKTYSRMLRGEPITQVSKTDEVQLEKTLPPAQSIVEMVKNGTLHSDNPTSMEENKTTSNSTSPIVTQSENTAPQEDAQPATPQEKKSVVEIVKENSLHSDSTTKTEDSKPASNNTQTTPKPSRDISPKEEPKKKSETPQEKKSETPQETSQAPISKPKNIPTCKYTKYSVYPHIVGKYYAFKDENGNRVSDIFENVSDFDENGIAYVRTRTYGLHGGDPYYYYINTNLERVSDIYSHASKFYRVGDIDMAVIKDRKDGLEYLINRKFEKISRGYPHIHLGPKLQKDGVPFTQIVVHDYHPHPVNRAGRCYFLDRNLQKASPEYYYVGHFEYYHKEYDEYITMIEVPGKKDYEYYLINEDFEIVSSELHGDYTCDLWDKHLIPQKVKSNKTYSKLMAGETPQDELLG